MSDRATTYKGGRTALIRAIRRLEQYEEWRKVVFIRDRFTCQHCGARNGRKRVIEADHITRLADLVKANGIVTIEQAVECPLLWDIDNGRTLCHSCHEQTETYPKNLKRKKNEDKKQYTRNSKQRIRYIRNKKHPQ